MTYLASLEGDYAQHALFGDTVGASAWKKLKRKTKNVARKTGRATMTTVRVASKVAPVVAPFVPGGTAAAFAASKIMSTSQRTALKKSGNALKTMVKKGIIKPADAIKTQAKIVAQTVKATEKNAEQGLPTPPAQTMMLAKKAVQETVETASPDKKMNWMIPAAAVAALFLLRK